MKIYVDLETYSATNLKTSGVYRYRADPAFRILMGAWSINGGPVELTLGYEQNQQRFDSYLARKATFVAHNAGFERVVLGGPVSVWDDTQARAGIYGYPQSLDRLAKALGAAEKDTAGTRLINLFCRPNKWGKRNLPQDYPEQWEQFKAYCIQDVATLVEVDALLPSRWPGVERAVWEVDQAINDRGIRVDLDLAAAAVEAADDNQMVHELEVMHLTGVANPASTQQLRGWLGDVVDDLKAETVEAALTRDDLDPTVRRVLELRQELAMTASKKYTAILAGASADARLRGGFRYFGAHTGRWGGRGAQLHNFPRAALPGDTEVSAAILDLKMGLGAPAYTLKALCRPTLVGPFTVVDYAAIEARVIAWLANETWALDAFRDGRDIYVETAERMGGLTRAQGKIAVLALGYNGAVGSLRAMGGDSLGTESMLVAMVQQWRAANPSIVKLWRQMEQGFRSGGPVGPRLRVTGKGRTRQIQLPSGRALTYHGTDFSTDRITFSDPKFGNRSDTYGGRLVENVTQAVARDILAGALVRLEAQGYRVVMHVHDEAVIEGEHDIDTVAEIMCADPGWTEGLPLDAEGYVTERYRK